MSKKYVFTKQHRVRLSKALKGRVFSEEHKKKIGDAHRNPSDKTRLKMSKSHKRWHAYRRKLVKLARIAALKTEQIEEAA